MRHGALLCLSFGLLLVVGTSPVRSQSVNMEHPHDIYAQKVSSPEEIRSRVANVQLQKDAKELAELCSTIQSDMDEVRKGLLSQDILKKLKRVEKLSKSVREKLTQ
jgi:hypothetical protein